MKNWLVTTLVSGAVALAAAPALAQEAGAPAAKPAQTQKAQRKASRLPSERMEERLAQLKSALKITPAQEPQWNTFADTLRKQARSADERVQARRSRAKDGKRAAPMNAIERLERRKAFLATAAARTDELLAAAKPLYAALSPEQQKVADDLVAKRGDRRARHRGGGHRHGRG